MPAWAYICSKGSWWAYFQGSLIILFLERLIIARNFAFENTDTAQFVLDQKKKTAELITAYSKSP